MSNNSLSLFFEEVKRLKEQGKDIIELNVGDPQVSTPADIIEKASEAMWKGKTHYVPPVGCGELREVLASRYSNSEKSNVAVSAGARVILNAVFSLLQADEKMMIPAPYYPVFKDIVDFNENKCLFVDTFQDDFVLTAEAVEKRIRETEVPRFLIVNSPNNPTGQVYPREEMEKLASLAREKGFIIISDECYKHFSAQNYSFRDIDPEAIVVDSCSKTYAMSGWRVGWCVAPRDVMPGIKSYLSVKQGSACSFAQEAAVEAIRRKLAISDFSRERKLIGDWLQDKGIPYPETNAGFYVFPDFSRFLGQNITTGQELASYLLQEVGVAVAPGEAFGDDYSRRIRISFCVQERELKRGLKRMQEALDKL